MKFIFILISIFTIHQSFSQVKALKISNKSSEKEILIKENKRVRITTNAGKKISGRLKIINNESILIKGKQIHLSEIEKIKKHPLAISLVTSIIFGYSAGITLVAGMIVSGFIGNPWLLVLSLPPIAALIHGTSKTPNFFKGYKFSKGWKTQVIILNNG